MNSINRHKNYLSFCSLDAVNIAATCSGFILSEIRKNVWWAGLGVDLPKLVDNHINVHFLRII